MEMLFFGDVPIGSCSSNAFDMIGALQLTATSQFLIS